MHGAMQIILNCFFGRMGYFRYMENGENPEKIVHINARISSIELKLPDHYKRYADDLRDEIRQRFSFDMIDSEFEERLENFAHEYLAERETAEGD